MEAQLREHVRAQQARRQQSRASVASRQQRRPTFEVSAEQRQRQAEHCYIHGLADKCPRCGQAAPALAAEAARRRHLRVCHDERAHAAHARAAAAAEGRLAAAAAGRAAQNDAGSLAAWRFLGGKASSAWMLTDAQLDDECAAAGLPTGGERVERLLRLASHGGPPTLLGDQTGSHGSRCAAAASSSASADAAATADALPDNLHALPLATLRELCASLGVAVSADSGTDQVVATLERLRGTDDAAIEAAGRRGHPSLLQDDGASRPAANLLL